MTKRNWCLVAAAAAIVAASPSVANAQNNIDNSATSTTTTSTTTTTTGTVTFTPIDIVTIAPPPMAPNGQPIDYTALSSKSFDYLDLVQAHAQGFSDSQIATIAKMSDKSGVPFNTISQWALQGQAFPTIADRLNVRLSDVLDSSDYQDKIANYRLAYENTGNYSVRNLVAGSEQELNNYGYGTNYSSSTYGSTSDNLAHFVNNAPNLTMFARALRSARMMGVLRGPGPLTIFAPTDAAFAKLSNDQINALMSNRAQLVRVLNYHIIPQRIDAAAALAMTSPTSPATLEGDTLNVTNTNGSLLVNGATVTSPDQFASNGVIHEIDTVLMPPASTTTTSSTTTTTTVTPNGTSSTTTTTSP